MRAQTYSPCMAHKSATGRISDAYVHGKIECGQHARSQAVQRIERQCQINDGRERKGKDGRKSVPVDGRRELRGAVRERVKFTHIFSLTLAQPWWRTCENFSILQKFRVLIPEKTQMCWLDDLPASRQTQRQHQLRINNQEIRAAIFHLRL